MSGAVTSHPALGAARASEGSVGLGQGMPCSSHSAALGEQAFAIRSCQQALPPPDPEVLGSPGGGKSQRKSEISAGWELSVHS